MTNKEAIICLQGLLENPLINKGSYLAQAIEVAIQALSQEPCRVKNELKVELNELKPCTDAVSRDAILEGLKGCICEEWIKTLFATMVKQLPSVTQKSETVTEFADRCRECGARYGKLLEQQPCDDAISRKLKIGDEIYIRANVNEIRNDYIICENKGGYFGTVREEIYPSVQSKSGEWIVDLQTATEDYYICSECGRRIHLLYPDTIDNYPYCHCGARMVKSQESEDKE